MVLLLVSRMSDRPSLGLFLSEIIQYPAASFISLEKDLITSDREQETSRLHNSHPSNYTGKNPPSPKAVTSHTHRGKGTGKQGT